MAVKHFGFCCLRNSSDFGFDGTLLVGNTISHNCYVYSFSPAILSRSGCQGPRTLSSVVPVSVSLLYWLHDLTKLESDETFTDCTVIIIIYMFEFQIYSYNYPFLTKRMAIWRPYFYAALIIFIFVKTDKRNDQFKIWWKMHGQESIINKIIFTSVFLSLTDHSQNKHKL